MLMFEARTVTSAHYLIFVPGLMSSVPVRLPRLVEPKSWWVTSNLTYLRIVFTFFVCGIYLINLYYSN